MMSMGAPYLFIRVRLFCAEQSCHGPFRGRGLGETLSSLELPLVERILGVLPVRVRGLLAPVLPLLYDAQ